MWTTLCLRLKYLPVDSDEMRAVSLYAPQQPLPYRCPGTHTTQALFLHHHTEGEIEI